MADLLLREATKDPKDPRDPRASTAHLLKDNMVLHRRGSMVFLHNKINSRVMVPLPRLAIPLLEVLKATMLLPRPVVPVAIILLLLPQLEVLRATMLLPRPVVLVATILLPQLVVPLITKGLPHKQGRIKPLLRLCSTSRPVRRAMVQRVAKVVVMGTRLLRLD
jgi:hypothetical protein